MCIRDRLKLHKCTPYSEVLVVSIRPYYLPREFSHVINVLVYIPEKKFEKNAINEVAEIIQDIECSHSEALVPINGDFNRCKLKKTTVTYYQHVTCETRDNAILDLCFSNVKDAYTSWPLPNLGHSDHNLVLLSPRYRPLIKTCEPKIIKVRKWSPEAEEALITEFEKTDWNIFTDEEDLNGITNAVSAYINFCIEKCVPVKTVKIYPNNKPWITKAVKLLLCEKRQAFKLGDTNRMKRLTSEIKPEIKKQKNIFRKKVEQNFKSNNMKKVWQGMKLMSGYTNSGNIPTPIPNVTVQYVNELNEFYNRFNGYDFKEERRPLFNSCRVTEEDPKFIVSISDVHNEFMKLNPSKAAGPDKIPPRVLNACSPHLDGIFTYIFNLCLLNHTFPDLWKLSCIIPVPKKPKITCMNDLRPVALTSVVMKTLERLILRIMEPYVEKVLDPLKFAYRSSRSTSDAILHKLHSLYSHLDNTNKGHSARIISVVCSVWTYRLACWAGNAAGVDRGRIDTFIRQACKMIGLQLPSISEVYLEHLQKTFHCIDLDTSHPLHYAIINQLNPSGRMRLLRAKTNRYAKSFIPSGINQFNKRF
ncbi:uncharacterized protein LOC117114163 [Anneissia japonica]|uniref:uncharacterized protein LOC117114163 n=1 Tax=Anneissia japonica TaxID=1529436 RepID=UPI0014258B26|nr:uncharacterized protein LOC117114163 [Anneissia japonica]